jgi:hypothetical protein
MQRSVVVDERHDRELKAVGQTLYFLEPPIFKF